MIKILITIEGGTLGDFIASEDLEVTLVDKDSDRGVEITDFRPTVMHEDKIKKQVDVYREEA